MKDGKVFAVGGIWYVHCQGMTTRPRTFASPPVLTKRGWCYFRRASAEEVNASKLDALESRLRAQQFAEERALIQAKDSSPG